MKIKEYYYPNFDYLRFFLASIVMFSHDKIIRWPRSGKLAVDVFFALSGWLIGGILLNISRDGLPKFFFNRAIRIWIPYYVALILIVAASVLRDPIDSKWLEFIFYKMTFSYNIFGTIQLAEFRDLMPLNGTGNHFWSVNAEEQFYLLAPLILVLLPKLGRTVTIWSALAVFAYISHTYAAISFGVLAAVLANKYGNFYSTVTAKILLFLILTTTALGLAIDGALVDDKFHLYSPIFSISIILLLAVKGKKQDLGVYLGGMSYPLYLNQWIGVFVLNALLDPFGLRDSGVRQILSIFCNYGIAALLYWQIDRRIISKRSSWFNEKRGIIATSCAYGLMTLGIMTGISMINT
jgi:peptidoglycan/LPS O-acetylase OafA/YrhL